MTCNPADDAPYWAVTEPTMQPRPSAETSRPLLPSVRFCTLILPGRIEVPCMISILIALKKIATFLHALLSCAS